MLLTAILPTTVEDLLALCLAAMVGYVSILNLPMRRAEAKRKLEHTTTAFAQVRPPRPGRFAGWRVHVVVVVVVGCVRVGVGVWWGGGEWEGGWAAAANRTLPVPVHLAGLQDIQAKMQGELKHALDVCEAEVLSFIAPLEQVGGAGGPGRAQGNAPPAAWGCEKSRRSQPASFAAALDLSKGRGPCKL